MDSLQSGRQLTWGRLLGASSHTCQADLCSPKPLPVGSPCRPPAIPDPPACGEQLRGCWMTGSSPSSQNFRSRHRHAKEATKWPNPDCNPFFLLPSPRAFLCHDWPLPLLSRTLPCPSYPSLPIPPSLTPSTDASPWLKFVFVTAVKRKKMFTVDQY